MHGSERRGNPDDPTWDGERDGQTALIMAVSQDVDDAEPEGVDRAEVVRILLESGANPNARDKHGNTALILCRERADIALLLIKAGADVTAARRKAT